jgi:hypothetical protein
MRVAWMKEGTGDKVDAEVADRLSLLAGSPSSPMWESDEG